MSEIEPLAEQEVDELVELRRTLHRHPELSGQEQRTAARVVEALSPLGFELRTDVAGHGIVADLVGQRPGPTLAYRADLDALPIEEDNDVPYRSTNPGVMHACGHDVHTTIAVGIARQLARHRDRLAGRIRFLFQPAEEAAPPPGEVVGAEKMVREGALDSVNAVVALHCHPKIEVGHFGYVTGTVLAASDLFQIRLHGRSAHGAYPHEGIDTVQMAAAVIQGLLAIPARLTDAVSPCVLTVGSVKAGTAHNILAGEADLRGMLRTFEDRTRKIAIDAVHRVVEHTATAHNGRGEVDFVIGAHAVRNHSQLTDYLTDVLGRSTGSTNVVPRNPQMGAEDFSAFSRRVPGCYFFLGVRNEDRGITHMIHTPRFDVDEACIPFAVEHMSDALLTLGRDWEARFEAELQGAAYPGYDGES
jgi:amidohydrolase